MTIKFTNSFSKSSYYLNTLNDIDISTLSTDLFDKYQQPILTEKEQKIPAPDLRKPFQVELIAQLLNPNNCANLPIDKAVTQILSEMK